MSAAGLALLGQGRAFARALRQARSRTLAHALMLVGARGSGKTTAARAIAQALLCEAAVSAHAGAACGACPACKKFLADAHPDLLKLEVPEDKKEIPVEQVRELLASLCFASSEGRGRVALIDPGDALNEHGQNALLKTLEEPGVHTWLLLPTTRPESLLATVRSRVQRLPILPLASAEVREGLLTPGAGIPAQESAELCIRLAGGSLGLAREMVAGAVDPLIALVDQALGGGAELTPPALAKALLLGASGKAEVEARARLVLLLLRARHREAASSMLGGTLDPAANASYSPDFLDRWIAVCDALCDAEEDLHLAIPVELALTGALLRIRSAQS